MANVVTCKKSIKKLKGERFFFDPGSGKMVPEPPRERKEQVAPYVIGDPVYFNESLDREFRSRREEREYAQAHGFIQKN